MERIYDFMTYDPKTYWSNRPNPTREEDILLGERAFLEPLIRDADLILDYGPGRGRLFELYRGKNVYGVDITERYQQECLKKAMIYNVNYRFGPLQGKFDLGIACKVLLHIPPDGIGPVISDLAEHCGKVAVLDIKTARPLQEHNFSHDFERLLEDYTIHKWKQQDDQLKFVYSK